MYMQLGTIRFEPLPVTGLSEEYSYEYPEHAVIEGKPILQYIGDGLDVSTVSIRLHFSFCDPPAVFAQIKALADSHQAQQFIGGDGTVYGMRVITRLTKTLVQTADNGRPMIIEAQLTLKEWVDTDPLGSRQASQRKSADGLQGKGPIGKIVPLPRQQAVIVAGQVKAAAAIIKQDAGQMHTLADKLKATYPDEAAQIQAASATVRAAVGPVVTQAQALAEGAQGATTGLQNELATISGIGPDITRITSGLPYPASIVGKRIDAVNSRISARATQAATLTTLTQGGAVEAGVRAQMITRMLPGVR